MKKVIIILLITLTIQKIKSQQSEYIIEHCVNKSTFQPVEGLVCSNDNKTKWFVISPTYLDNTSSPIVDGFSILKFNLGTSSANDKLVIKFIDNTLITLSSNKITQDKYHVDVLNIYNLKNKAISYIRYVNALKGTYFIYHLKENEKTYIANALTNIVVKQVKCIDKMP